MNPNILFYPISMFYSRIVLNKITLEQRLNYRNVERDFKKIIYALELNLNNNINEICKKNKMRCNIHSSYTVFNSF